MPGRKAAGRAARAVRRNRFRILRLLGACECAKDETGRLPCDRGRHPSRGGRPAAPLSLSMPLAAEEHGPSAVQAFLWGLLPDNEHVLER
ncbi:MULTISPECIES: HipA N-terminal domain-containing protein [unclassified Bradyrhizobium]|uniref:HipA N-terminal domain-containing protein n=1 Tax=unclassified Bradyrhizobium TaxID=2631580 RepID=UPI0033995F51